MISKGKKLLIVEDEVIIAMDLQTSLENQGYIVIDHVTRGEDVFKVLEINRPDIILIDVKLEGEIDGVETAQMIYDNYDIPVIFITSYSNKSIIERAKKTNPFGYIVKPFEDRELFTNIELAFFKHESEIKLKESEKKYRELSESIQQIIIEFDAEGIIKYLNEPGMQILGVTKPELSKNISITKFVGYYGLEQINNRINVQLNNSSQKLKRELVLLNKFGKHFFIEEYLTPVYINNQLISYRGLLIDITSKKLKDTLHSLYNKVTLLYDEFRVNPFDIIEFLLSEFKKQFYYIEDIYFNETVIAENRIITHRNGISSERAYANGHSEYVIETKRPLYLRGRELEMFNSTHEFEIYGTKAVCWSGFPINFQNRNYGVFVFQSFKNENALITNDFESLTVFFNNINSLLERISYLKEIQKSEEKYKHLVNSINEGLIQLDLNAKITYINQRFCNILKYEESEVIGKSLFDAVKLSDDNIEQLKNELASRKKGFRNQYEINVKTKDGENKALIINSSPFTNSAGHIMGSIATIIDVTEKKEFQKIIKDSEQKFKAIFDQAAVGVAIVNSKTSNILEANKKYSQILRYSPQELLELKLEETTHIGDLKLYLLKMKEILKDKISEFSIEKRHIKKNGSIVWTNLTVSPLWQKGEEPVNHIAIIEDITTRKLVEENLVKSEQEKENVLNAIPDSFLVVSKEGLILNSYCKDNENIIKRVHNIDINGCYLTDTIQLKLIEQIEKNINLCLSSQQIILTDLDFNNDEQHNWFEIRYIPINIDSVLMIIRNVTSIRRNISELQKFHNITEQSKELIMITNKEGVIEYINPAFSIITGYSLDELKGKNPSFFKSEKHPTSFYRNIWDTILKGHSTKCNIVNAKKNGEIYIEEKIISPLFNDNNEITHFISTGKDVTEDIKREKKIKTYEKFEKILEKRENKYRTFALIQGQENERKRIAREIHDGLGQLLTVASANLESVKLTNIKTKEDRNKIEIVNQMVAEIIQESRRISYNLSPVGLYEFGLEAVLKQFVKRININFNDLIFNLKSNLKQTRFSNDIEINLYRIIQEVVQNSLKHSQANKINITIDYKGNLLKLIIEDNGVGFDYSQLVTNTNSKHLNGIRNIEERAKIIDAKLHIFSEMGKGFKLELALRTKNIKHG
jgi:PAS domain S-box-containing protein